MVIINNYEPLHVKMGRTLLVSGVGLLVILLSTLVLVPLNGFWMNKKLGAGLILAYTVSRSDCLTPSRARADLTFLLAFLAVCLEY